MKTVIRRIARILLPFARATWRCLPHPMQQRLRPGLRRARTAVGLGNWTAARTDPSTKLVAAYHPFVPLPITAMGTVRPAPTSPVDPIVSVVITAHDDGPFIDIALRSVRSQDLREWECIVVDDASVDDTTTIALRHAEADPRISLVRRDRNVGLAAARNTGIASARGEFVTFLDADDFMFPNTLGARVDAARSSGDRIAGSWCDWASVSEATGLDYVTPRPGKFSTIDYTTGGGENQVISTSPLVRRDVLVSLGGYDDSFRTAEDFEFATRLFRNGFQLAFAPVVGVAYRQKRMSMIAGDPLGHARNAMRVYDYMARPLDPAATSSLATAPYTEPPPGIPSPIRRLERLITFLTFAVLGGDDAQRDGVYQLLPPGLLGPSTFMIDLDGRIDGAIRRHTTRTAGLTKAERTAVESSVKALLARRGNDTDDESAIEPHLGIIDPDRIRRLPPSRSRVRPARSIAPAGSWDVLLRADSADAIRELVLVGRELVEHDLRVALIDDNRPDSRRLALTEGIHRVTDPLGAARLLISSAGQSVDAAVDRHLIISAEAAPLPASATADAVHVRGHWERAETDWEVVGWHSRHDRLLAAATPADGQSRRERTSCILVVGSPDRDHGVSSIRSAADRDALVFDSAFKAGPEATLPLEATPGIMAHLHAVIVVGSRPTPAEALAFGTPVLRVGGAPARADETAVNLTELAAVLAAIQPAELEAAEPDADPLGSHVAQALRLLES
ncbi:MAG: glycosyltransferase family A protein [Actinomycetota bacterium]